MTEQPIMEDDSFVAQIWSKSKSDVYVFDKYNNVHKRLTFVYTVFLH